MAEAVGEELEALRRVGKGRWHRRTEMIAGALLVMLAVCVFRVST